MSTMNQHQLPHRIAFFTGSFESGGMEHYLLRMLEHTDRRRFAPVVVTLSDTGPLREQIHELAPVVPVHLTGKLFNWQGIRELWRIRRVLKEREIDLVHGLMDWSTVFGAAAARLAGMPLVASHRMTVFPPAMSGALASVYAVVLRFAAVHVIPNSVAVAAVLEEHGVRPDRMTVVHNGIPAGRAPATIHDRTPPADGSVTVCAVGGLRPEKGHRVAVQAVARLCREGVPIRLRLVGDGPDRAALRELVEQLDIASSVEFAGYVPNPAGVLQQSDLCLLPSHAEGFPNAVVEYMAAGRAVVATAVGGVPEVVRDGVNGLLVPPGDVDAMANAIRRLAGDPDLRRRMGQAGRALVEAEFTAEHEAERTMAVYDRVLARE